MKANKRLISIFCLLCLVTTSQAQQWEYTGSMAKERFVFQMVALDNEKVLAIGGQDQLLKSVKTCELYDPATETWQPTGSLAVERANFRAVKLTNGDVLAIGGQIGDAGFTKQTSTVERYNASSGVWSVVGNLNHPRQNYSLAHRSDSEIYILGGLTEEGVTNTCEVYNAITNTSNIIGSMHSARHDLMSVVLQDGRILIGGGRDGGAGSVYWETMELFDPALNSWSFINPMLQKRIMGVLHQFSDGRVLAAGGRNSPTSSATGSEMLDVNLGDWTPTDAMLEPCAYSANVVLPGDRYLMTGGQIDGNWASGTENVTTTKCEWYDLQGSRWYFAPTLRKSRDKQQLIYSTQSSNPNLPSEYVLVAGGLEGVWDTIGQSAVLRHRITETAEIMDVREQSMEFYIAHLNSTAGVRSGQSTSELISAGKQGLFLSELLKGATIVVYDLVGRELKRLVINRRELSWSELHLPGGTFTAVVHGSQACSKKFFVPHE